MPSQGAIKWNEMPWEKVNDQISRRVFRGDRLMAIMYKMKAPMVWPVEEHEAEQIEHLLSGKLEFTVNGETHVILPGDSFFVGSYIPHEGRIVEDMQSIVIFTPPRKELMEEGQGFAPYAKK